MKRFSCAAIVLLVITALPLTVLAKEWELDRAHSNIYFSVDHIFSKVRGHFDSFSAVIRFDPNRPEEGSFRFTVKTDSVNTNLAKRDKHLQSKDFFDSGKYGEMRFVSTGVTSKGDGELSVSGKLTVKGKEYPFTLPFRITGVKGHPAVRGKDVIGLDAGFSFDRLDHGVGTGKFAEMGVVGRKVDVLVSLELLADRK